MSIYRRMAAMCRIPHNVGDVVYWNGSELAFVHYTLWSSSLGTPLAVCVIPTRHAMAWGDGKARFCSIWTVTSSGAKSTSHTELSWGPRNNISALTNYNYGPVWDNVAGGSVSRKEGALLSYSYISMDLLTGSSYPQNVYDPSSRYYTSPYAVGPYKSDGGFNTDYKTVLSGNNAFSDFDGKGNTAKIMAYTSSAEAAKGCYNYSADGIPAGEWYLPAEGEMLYIPSRMKVINAAISACGGLSIPNSYRHWSSTEQDASDAWGMSSNGTIICGIKTYDAYVRPFCKLD